MGLLQKAVGNLIHGLPGTVGETLGNNIRSDGLNWRGESNYDATPINRAIEPGTKGLPTANDASGASDAYGAYGGSSQPSYSKEDLAYLDSQQGALDRQLGRTDTTLQNSLAAILQNYNKELTGANTTRGRNIEDFNTKTQTSEMGRQRELGKVDTNARVLANSLRQRLGLASGSGSSAYQVAAPKAVQREQSDQRTGVLTDYATNFQALDTDKKRAEQDFASLLDELNKQKTAREGGVVGDIEEQRNQIRDNLARVAGERAKLTGGGYAGVRAAMTPYEQQIANGESLIDSIYNKYAAKYDVKPLQVNNTQLRDYATDPAAVQQDAQPNTEDPFAQALKKQDEEQPIA